MPWTTILEQLNHHGFATVNEILSAQECKNLIELYGDRNYFRNRVIMQRHAFGQGEYQYFANPLPAIVMQLRQSVYARLAPLANRWQLALGTNLRFPETLQEFLQTCHQAGQVQPTPLLLKYEPGDFNCLHQDLYGSLAFPFQMTVLLSEPENEFSGGEFVLVEQRPRAQSKAEVVSLRCGEAVIFAVNQRPVSGKRGFYRVNLKHGVSRVRSGQRYSLGIIFHDAAQG